MDDYAAVHQPICRPWISDEIWGIKILPNNGGARPTDYFQHHLIIRPNDPILHHGERCPVTERFGVPLLIYSSGISQGRHGGNEIAMKIATKLRAYASSAFAPERWQHSTPGECTVMREDCKPLTKELLEAIYSFISHLMGYPIGREGWASWEGLLSPSVWQMYAKQYYEQRFAAGQQPGFDTFFPLVD
jgi:hypothetical protein